MIIYDRLWITMKEKGESQYTLITKYGMSPAQISRLRHNKGVSTHTINRLCSILHCKVNDVMEFIED